MTTARFRVDSLVVEGFKAFAGRKEILFDGRHCFLFGANARGKSSIVEAIRWCLFGSERDSDVRNRFSEGGDCEVELRLRDSSGLWRIQRRLRPGQLKSDQTILNPVGKEVKQKDALPNLVPLGSSVGAVVFFSAQQAARVRSYGDLTRFHEVLYTHLDLGDAERLRTEMEKVHEEAIELERLSSQRLQRAEESLQVRMKDVDARIDEILRRPPWEIGEVPTRLLSESRIRAFVTELASQVKVVAEPTLSCQSALDHADAWIVALSQERTKKINQSSEALTSERDQLQSYLQSVRGAYEKAAAELARAEGFESSINDLCEGVDLTDLESALHLAKSRLNSESQMIQLRKAASPLLNSAIVECPLCGARHEGTNLLTVIDSRNKQTETIHARIAEEVDSIESRFERAKATNKQLNSARAAYELADREWKHAVDQISSRLSCSIDEWEPACESRMSMLTLQLEELKRDGQDATGTVNLIHQRLRQLREEWRYHELRDEQQKLRGDFGEGLQPARDRLRNFEDLRSTVSSLTQILSEEFDAAIDRALPGIGNELTQAFRRLTNHPAFDLLRVERAQGADKLVVRIGSTQASVPWSRPEDVLNGGAYAALGLIPHFVFSSFHGEQAELNILIVDDPSQAFDTKHVELLFEELRRAGEHGQLILASHEEDRFGRIVREQFKEDSFKIIRVTDFKPLEGPTIEY